VLPQVVLVSRSLCTVAAELRIRQLLPSNVYLLVLSSGWNNSKVMLRILRLVKDRLASLWDRVQCVLLMDAARIHLDVHLLNAASRTGFWTVIVPTKTTWFLQPLDVGVFSGFKRFLRELFREDLEHPALEETYVETAIRLLCVTITDFLEKKAWRQVFLSVGLSRDQKHVSRTVLQSLQYEAVPPISAEHPTEAELELVLPRRTRVPFAALFRPFQAPARPYPLVEQPLEAIAAPLPSLPTDVRDPDHPTAPHNVWFGRTRSTSRPAAVGSAAPSCLTAPPLSLAGAAAEPWIPQSPSMAFATPLPPRRCLATERLRHARTTEDAPSRRSSSPSRPSGTS